MHKKKITTLILICFISVAQTQTVLDASIQQYTTENGLPSNGIKGLQWEEKTGFLWLATEAGIVRFNGVDFRSFTNANTPSLNSERILFLTRNYQKKIFASDLLGTIFSIEYNKPILWRNKISEQSPYYANYYLLAVSEKYFEKFEGYEPTQKFSLSTDNIIALSDTACLIHRGNSVYYQSISSIQPKILFENKSKIATHFKLQNKVFFITTENKILKFSENNESISSNSLKQQKGFNINVTVGKFFWNNDSKTVIYIQENNAWILGIQNNQLVSSLIFSNIPTDALIRFAQYSSKNKTLFIGTDSKGIFILNKKRVLSKKALTNNEQNRNAYYSQIALDSNHVLTNEGVIISSNNLPYRGILPIQNKFSFHVSITNDSIMWFTQYNKKLGYSTLHSYNTKTNKTTTIYSKNIENVVTYYNGSYYTANSKGICKIINDSLHFIYTYKSDLKDNITYCIDVFKKDKLLIASCKGLFIYNIETNALIPVFNEANNCVRTFWKYKDYIFFGTYGSGFYIWKDDKIKPMPLDKNKYLLYTHGFVDDKLGYCWMSTNRGLFKASLNELIEVFEKNTSTVYYHYFGKKDGMEMTEMNGGCSPTTVTLPNKIISFPTMDGLLWVNPITANPILPNGEIFVDEIVVDNQPKNYLPNTQLQLPANTQQITVKLAFAAWCNQENIYIDYQLNKDTGWTRVNTNNESEIQLTNLPSGEYSLKIRKLNGFGFNNYTYKEIQFTIATPWYKQWWFFVLCSLSILGFISLYITLRTKQFRVREQKLEEQVNEKTKTLQVQNEILEKNNSIKTKLISIISHDIVTPLKFVTVAGKNLLEKKNLMSEELQQETLQEITNTSQELQLLSTNILNWIKYQNENRRLAKEKFIVYDLVNQVLSILKSLAKQKGLQLINNIDTNLEIYQYYEPLKILIYNLLTNAIHFSENSEIVISSTKDNDFYTIAVTDKGSGMTKEQVQNIMEDKFVITSANIDNKKGHGLGYMIIKDLLITMGATIKIVSEKNKGTKIEIMLKIEQKI